ncbi:MAG TPA: dephospho-CoA kinase [Paludibacteraceae bacterium]|nr:dephospho-CoA kinase [Paludibacteraceae bacterium]
MLKVGITGGIGSGKSVVSDIIRLLGYPVYSSDERAKELSDTNAHIRKALVALFGDDMYEDNHLNRSLLASSIFSDTSKIAEVNAIIHPVVFADFNQWCKEQTSRLVFAESAIIVESGFSVFMDTIILVDAPENLRIERVVKRDKTTVNAVRKRMKSQFPIAELRDHANYVIHNDNEQLLLPQVIMIIENLLSV